MRETEVTFESDGVQVIGVGSVSQVSGQDRTHTHKHTRFVVGALH